MKTNSFSSNFFFFCLTRINLILSFISVCGYRNVYREKIYNTEIGNTCIVCIAEINMETS